MKKRRLAGIILCGLAMAACSDGGEFDTILEPGADVGRPQQATAGVVASVHGSGHRVLVEGTSDRVVRRFTIAADGMADGTASGRYNLVIGPGALKARGSVTCVNVTGNRAFVGGDVDPGYLEAIFPPDIVELITGIALEFVDNGEGPDAAPDEISALAFFLSNPTGPQDWCDAATPGGVSPIDMGDIQVR